MPESGRKLRAVYVEDIPVRYDHDGREQIRRLVTNKREDFERFSFHVIHFDANLEKDVTDIYHKEVVMFVLQGYAEISLDSEQFELRPGVALAIPPETVYHHKTGPQGMTVVVCVSPPSE